MKTLGRLFVKTLALGPQSEDAKKLTLQGMASTVDYGNLVYSVMEHRSPASSSLMVSDVNKYLDLMADHFKQNERSSKMERNVPKTTFFLNLELFNIFFLQKLTQK